MQQGFSVTSPPIWNTIYSNFNDTSNGSNRDRDKAWGGVGWPASGPPQVLKIEVQYYTFNINMSLLF